MRNLLLSLCLLTTYPVFSQDLHIYLDAHTEQIVYVSGKDTLDRPRVKMGDQVYIHLINYNNYLYDVEIDLEGVVDRYRSPVDTLGLGLGNAKHPEEGTGTGLFSMLHGLGGGLGLDLTATGPAGLFQMMGLSQGIKGEGADFEGAEADQQVRLLAAEYRTVLSDMRAIEVDLQRINSALERAFQAKLLQGKVAHEIGELQMNPHLQPGQIKRLTHEYMDLVFEQTAVEELNMERIWAISDRQQAIQEELGKAENGQAALAGKAEQLERLSKRLEAISVVALTQKDIYEELSVSMEGTHERVGEALERLDGNLVRIKEQVQQLPEDDFEELVALRYLYEELVANDFSYTYRTIVKDDLTKVRVALKPKEGLPAGLIPGQRVFSPLEIPARGSFKVSAGLGLSFARYFNPPQAYFLRDTSILAEDEDSFAPHLTSFVHFYRQTAGAVSYGGSFGVGMPIFNSDGGQSVSFFLGPSIMVGDRQRLVLTGGIMGGRVKRLGNGYQVGDSLPAGSPSIPTDFRFQLGYFLGLTFNVSG
jgi:hypothetical protein